MFETFGKFTPSMRRAGGCFTTRRHTLFDTLEKAVQVEEAEEPTTVTDNLVKVQVLSFTICRVFFLKPT